MQIKAKEGEIFKRKYGEKNVHTLWVWIEKFSKTKEIHMNRTYGDCISDLDCGLSFFSDSSNPTTFLSNHSPDLHRWDEDPEQDVVRAAPPLGGAVIVGISPEFVVGEVGSAGAFPASLRRAF